jgi:hypothetical protein
VTSSACDTTIQEEGEEKRRKEERGKLLAWHPQSQKQNDHLPLTDAL